MTEKLLIICPSTQPICGTFHLYFPTYIATQQNLLRQNPPRTVILLGESNSQRSHTPSLMEAIGCDKREEGNAWFFPGSGDMLYGMRICVGEAPSALKILWESKKDPPPPTPPRSSPPQTPAPLPPPRHPQPPLAPPPKSLPPSRPPRQPPPTPRAPQDPADCQDALIYVDVCIRDLITFFFEKDGSSVGQNCCDAISELSDDCFSEAFAGFSDPEFIKRVRDYCAGQFHV
nr:formin-like protein 2 [Coffea arabica]